MLVRSSAIGGKPFGTRVELRPAWMTPIGTATPFWWLARTVRWNRAPS